MKQIFFFFILCLSFSCNNSNTQDLKEVPTGVILIKGGEFLMGADNNQAMRDEYPQHKVIVNSFFMVETEVTIEDSKKLVDFPRPEKRVVGKDCRSRWPPYH